MLFPVNIEALLRLIEATGAASNRKFPSKLLPSETAILAYGRVMGEVYYNIGVVKLNQPRLYY